MQGKEERERRKEETVTTSFEVGVDRESAGWRAACLATRCQPRLIDGLFISDVDTSASANPFVKDVLQASASLSTSEVSHGQGESCIALLWQSIINAARVLTADNWLHAD